MGVERHELDEPDNPACTAGEVGERKDLVVVLTTQEHDVDLQRSQTGRSAASMAPRTRPGRLGGGWAEPVGPEGITADVDPMETGRSQPVALPSRCMPLVVRAESSKPSRLSPDDEAGSASSDERLAAGHADAGHTALRPTRANRMISANESCSCRG